MSLCSKCQFSQEGSQRQMVHVPYLCGSVLSHTCMSAVINAYRPGAITLYMFCHRTVLSAIYIF